MRVLKIKHVWVLAFRNVHIFVRRETARGGREARSGSAACAVRAAGPWAWRAVAAGLAPPVQSAPVPYSIPHCYPRAFRRGQMNLGLLADSQEKAEAAHMFSEVSAFGKSLCSLGKQTLTAHTAHRQREPSQHAAGEGQGGG